MVVLFSSWWCTYRSSFGEPAPNESAASAPLVAASSSAAATSSGVGGAPLAFAFAAVAETSPHADPPALDGAMALDRYAAAAPATCGHAMLVPLIVLVASSSPIQADFTSEPGAKMSTHAPKLEKPLLASSRAVAPTVMAVGAFAGEYPHASSLALPAATTTVMLRPCMYAAASTRDCDSRSWACTLAASFCCLQSEFALGDAMAEWLSGRRGSSVEVRVPIRGELAKLRGMADRNAEIHLVRSARAGNLEKAAADEGAKLLGLETLDHVVCFDMSQSLGKERVGASVVLRKGRPSNQDYRTYRVKSDAQDDLRMMAEVVSRWAKRQEEWPDLLLLDGGETHLSAIERTLEGMGLLGEFPVAALAKREETLFMRGLDPILLDRRGRTLVHARDEAHRFSNTFHKKRRGKGALADPLEEVEGLGAKKIQALLRHFGGRKGIEHASVRDLREVPGIGKEMAERILGHLQR